MNQNSRKFFKWEAYSEYLYAFSSLCFPIEKGYVAILSVLTVGAVAVTVGFSLLLLGISNAKSGVAVEDTGLGRALANLCVEEALQQIRNSTLASGIYTSSGFVSPSLSGVGGTCSYQVFGAANFEVRGIRAIGTPSGTLVSSTRKVFVSLTHVTPILLISSWQEVADFNPGY